MEGLTIAELTMDQYKQKMEKKYKYLKLIDSKLLEANSWSRGEILYNTLNTINAEDLKYYIFCKWWDSIDSYHNFFEEWEIREWLDNATVKLNLDKYQFDSDGSLTVYRGIHELNQSWEGLSWTTNVEVAKRFANGCGVRFPTKHPKLLIGKVYKWNILATFDARNEKEILCEIDTKVKEIDLNI